MRPFILGLLALAAPATAEVALSTARSSAQYQHFFPGWRPILEPMLGPNGTCEDEMKDYKNVIPETFHASYRLLDCILTAWPEFRKAELGAASVVLGIAPALLQLLSPTPAETAVLASGRPLLAIMISGSMPSARSFRDNTFGDVIGVVDKALPAGTSPRFPFNALESVLGQRQTGWLVAVIEYLIISGALANAAYRVYQLSIWAVCTFSPLYIFLPIIWYCTGPLVHLAGWAAGTLKLKTPPGGHLMIWRNMFTPQAWADDDEPKPEIKCTGWQAYCYSVLEFAIFIGVHVQLVFGTMVLSSLVFISMFDSIVLVSWLSLSVIACRMVLDYEMAGLRGRNATTSKVREAAGIQYGEVPSWT